MSTKTLFSILLELLGFVFVLFYFHSYIAERKGIEYNHTLKNGARLFRDENGIPHIEADNINDGFFALGFVHAEDRLWQMFLNVKIATGQLSQMFGDLTLDLDKFSRVVNFDNKCRKGFEDLNDDIKQQVKSYSNGVNHYIKTAKAFPLEFKLFGINEFVWEDYYSCLGAKLIEYFLSVDYMQEMVRTFLLENLNMNKDTINKMFPFNYEHFEYKTSIIKEDELQNLKYKSVKESDIKIKEEHIPKEVVDRQQLDDIIVINNNENKDSKSYFEILDLSDDIEIETHDGDKVNEKIENNQKVLSDNINETQEKSENEIKKDSTIYRNNIDSNIANDEFKPTENLNSYTLNKGSNNFVISGKYTKNGKPLLCNDPHLMNGIPAFWYMSNLKVGEYNFVGASHPGLPVYFIGTNGFVSWGITNGFVDTSDVFKVKRTNVEGEFILDGKIKKLKKRSERIYFNSKKDKFQEIIIWESEYGPVINGYFSSFYKSHHYENLEFKDQNEFYYIVSGNFLQEKFANGFTNFFMQKDHISFRQSLKDIDISLNIVYMDNNGNIGYQSTGKLPKLIYKEQGGFISYVEYSNQIEKTTIPFEEMPYLVNPERGFIVTANNHIIEDKYIHRLNGGFMIDTRAKAIEKSIQNLVNQGQKIDEKVAMENLLNILEDTYCTEVLGLIFNTLEKDQNYKKIMNESSEAFSHQNYVLEKFSSLKNSNFNCIMTGDSKEALIFNVFEKFLVENLNYHVYESKESYEITIKDNARKNIIYSQCRENYVLYKLKLYNADAKECKKDYNSTCLEFFLKTLYKTFEYIDNRFSKNEKYWKWKNLIKKSFSHKPFSMIPLFNVLSHRVIETEGNSRTPRVAYYRVLGDFDSVVSSNYKMIVFSSNNGMKAFVSVDVGQNGKIFNKYYDNLLLSHEKADLNFVEADNLNQSKYTLKFEKIDLNLGFE